MTIKMVLFDKCTREVFARFSLIPGLKGVTPVDITYASGRLFPENDTAYCLWAFLNSRAPKRLDGESTEEYDIRMGELIGINYKKSGFGRMNEELRGVVSMVNRFEREDLDNLACAPEEDCVFLLSELDAELNVIFTLRRWDCAEDTDA